MHVVVAFYFDVHLFLFLLCFKIELQNWLLVLKTVFRLLVTDWFHKGLSILNLGPTGVNIKLLKV